MSIDLQRIEQGLVEPQLQPGRGGRRRHHHHHYHLC